ncbi:MAG TPA: HEAT repeat domain-containing protein [Ktedonobacteraceae bacterium]|jgi:HEAT repeat protein
MNAQEIIHLLEEPTENRTPRKQKITAEASIEDLIAAMHEPTAPLTRQILCDIVGDRHAAQALPELLAALKDASPNVRSAAADALASIGDSQAGPALLERYRADEDRDVRVMIAVALGAVHYQPAIPDLIQALDDPYETLQMEAAWSLGELKAAEARGGLQRVLARQTDDYSRKLVQDALGKLDK